MAIADNKIAAVFNDEFAKNYSSTNNKILLLLTLACEIVSDDPIFNNKQVYRALCDVGKSGAGPDN